METIFFTSPADFRSWLEKNHQQEKELWVGYYKKATDIPSITWPESVDQALCFGWIDGLRKRIDEKSYKIRFTPRRANSHWSDVNIKKVHELKKLGLMHPCGLSAFEKLNENQSRNASYERKTMELSPEYSKQLESHPKAWDFFQTLSPSIQKQCIWWVMSAKKEETRLRRLNILIDSSSSEERIPLLR